MIKIFPFRAPGNSSSQTLDWAPGNSSGPSKLFGPQQTLRAPANSSSSSKLFGTRLLNVPDRGQYCSFDILTIIWASKGSTLNPCHSLVHKCMCPFCNHLQAWKGIHFSIQWSLLSAEWRHLLSALTWLPMRGRNAGFQSWYQGACVVWHQRCVGAWSTTYQTLLCSFFILLQAREKLSHICQECRSQNIVLLFCIYEHFVFTYSDFVHSYLDNLTHS